MIVADTNIISYLLSPTDFSEKASQLYQKDSDWAAPGLYKSLKLRNLMLSTRSYTQRYGLALGKNNMIPIRDFLLKLGKQMSNLTLHSEHILKFLLHFLKAILRRFLIPFPPDIHLVLRYLMQLLD